MKNNVPDHDCRGGYYVPDAPRWMVVAGLVMAVLLVVGTTALLIRGLIGFIGDLR